MSGLRAAFDEIVADVPVYGDLDRAIDQARQERRRRVGVVASLSAAAAVLVVVAGLLVISRDDDGTPQPIGPTPTPAPTERTPAVDTWEPPEPLRPGASRVVQHDQDGSGTVQDWDDPRDATVAEIDILAVGEAQDFNGGSSWRFRFAARPPIDPAGRVIGYGVVVDGDGDRKADCQIGINNDAPKRGALHVWVTNLRTRETAFQDGPPYGIPVEFAHPAEGPGRPGYPPEMQFGFLGGLKLPTPCDPFENSATYYVWSSVAEGGQITATDYAPDAAWLPISFGN